MRYRNATNSQMPFIIYCAQLVLNSRSSLESGGVLEAIETEAVAAHGIVWSPDADSPRQNIGMAKRRKMKKI